ncbi:MAG: hypothetical protein WCI04_02740 [archaeon]
MAETTNLISIQLNAEQIIYSFQESLKSYNKLRMKGKGTKGNYYFINVPRLYIGARYAPNKKFAVSFGLNKVNNHQLVVIDLDDQKETNNWISDEKLLLLKV